MARRSPAREPVATRVPFAEARANLGAIIERLHTGNERFIIEKDGEAVAVLMDVDEFEDYLELQDPEVNETIAKGREEHLAGKSRPAAEPLRELNEEEERERQPEKTMRYSANLANGSYG